MGTGKLEPYIGNQFYKKNCSYRIGSSNPFKTRTNKFEEAHNFYVMANNNELHFNSTNKLQCGLNILPNQFKTSGCGVAHRVVHTTLVQEDLGSILHPSPGRHFSEALISLLSDNRLKNDYIHL